MTREVDIGDVERDEGRGVSAGEEEGRMNFSAIRSDYCDIFQCHVAESGIRSRTENRVCSGRAGFNFHVIILDEHIRVCFRRCHVDSIKPRNVENSNISVVDEVD